MQYSADLSEVIRYRLIEIERAIKQAIDKVKEKRLNSTREKEIKDILIKNLNDFLAFSKEILEKQIQKLNTDTLIELVDHYRTSCDYYLSLIEYVLSGESAIELYYFLDAYVDLFPEIRNKVEIVIARGETPLTFPIFPIFKKQSQEQQIKRLWVILVPPRVENNPFEWPIILHELAHILEAEEFKIIKKRFGSECDPQIARETESTSEIDRCHCLEYMCDYFALLMCGLIWLFRLYDIYLIPTYRLPKTHPEWFRRIEVLGNKADKLLKALDNLLDSMIKNQDPGAKSIKDFVQSIRNMRYSCARYTLPDELPKVLEDLENELSQRSISLFTLEDLNSLEKVFNDLRNLRPYIGDISLILNAGYLVYRFKFFSKDVLEYFRRKEKEEKEYEYKLVSEFIYLISDCIRSTRIYSLARRILSSKP